MASLLSAWFTVFRCIFSAVSVILKSIQSFVHFKDYISATTTVTSVGTTLGDVLLTTKVC